MKNRTVVAGLVTAFSLGVCLLGADRPAGESPIAAEILAIEARVARGEIKGAASDAQTLLERTEGRYGPDASETAEAIVEHVWLQLLDTSIPRPELKPLAERALRIFEDRFGPDAPTVATALDKLSTIAQRAPDFPVAQEYRERAVAIFEKSLGPEHPSTLDAKAGQALLLRNLGEFDKARHLYEEVLAAYERTGAGTPFDRVNVLNNLSTVFIRLGDAAAAQLKAEQGLALARASFKDEPVLVGKLLLNLGVALAMQIDFASAAARLRQAIPILEKGEGPNSPNVAACLSNLGVALNAYGDPVGALPYLRRSVAGYKASFGPDHPGTLSDEVLLASVLIDLGQTEEARPLLESARPALSKYFGPENPQLFAALSASARLELAEGNYQAAREFAERELAMAEDTFGADSAYYATAAADAAPVFMELGNLAEARRIVERLLALEPNASFLGDLALIERRSGNLAAAQRAIDRAIEMESNPLFPSTEPSQYIPQWTTERAWILAARGNLTKGVEEMRKGLGDLDALLGPTHPASTAARLNLADLLARAGRPGEARPLFEQALAASASLYGKGSVAVATQRNQFAEFEALHGDRSGALRIALDAAATVRNSVRGTARYLTEREALTFENARGSGLDIALWVLGRGKESSSSVGQVWDEVIRSRAVILDEMATRHKLSFRGGNPELAALVRRAAAARERLARLAADPEPSSGARFRASWDRAVQDRDQIEREIAQRTAEREERDRDGPDWRSLAARLGPDDAVVAYVQYDTLPSPLAGSPQAAYLAFVLRPNARSPFVVSIGPAGTVDKLVVDWRQSVAQVPPALAGATGRNLEARVLTAGRALRQRVWDPVAVKLRGARRVFVVPDGALNLVNPAALPDDADGYLVESGPLFHLLSTERDLLVTPHHSPSTRGMLAVGGVDFDADPVRAGEPAEATTADSRPAKAARFRGERPSCTALRSLRFDSLPGTEIEASTVSSLWNAAQLGSDLGPAQLLNGPAADEGSFKDLAGGHRVIHVATHGFFADAECAGHGNRDASDDNPLLQSGLAFAGANRRAEASRKDVDDGMLTAEEIGSLDLTGTEWVVLSSCGSGMGRVVAGEGVLGLRRAFEVAGAGTLVTTLWRVNDAATLDWIRELYRARLDGASTAESVRRASLSVIAARRASGLSVVPFYWGAFVASGDWR